MPLLSPALLLFLKYGSMKIGSAEQSADFLVLQRERDMCTKKEAEDRTQQQRGGTFGDRAQQYADAKNTLSPPAQGDEGRNPHTQRFLETGIGGQDCSRPAIF